MADKVNAKVESGQLDALATAAGAPIRGLPPVHLWDPPYCGDIGLKIARDGTWSHQGEPIVRPALVRLFSTILRRDPEGFRLVTPTEKIAIEVEDAPFLAVAMHFDADLAGGSFVFRTNMDEEIIAGPQHPLRFETGPTEGIKPYLHVRGELWALLTRATTYDLIAHAQIIMRDGQPQTGVSSGGHFFVMES